MKKYEKAEITFLSLSFEDVITTSGGFVVYDDGAIDGELDYANGN